MKEKTYKKIKVNLELNYDNYIMFQNDKMPYKYAILFQDMYSMTDEWKKYERRLNNFYSKRKRVRSRIKYILTHFKYAYFITLTFEDKYLTQDKSQFVGSISRLEQVIRKEVLKGKNYVINYDYAPKTNRLHFHGVVGSLSPFESLEWRYGFTSKERINNEVSEEDKISEDNIKDINRIGKYVVKLTNHSFKIEEEKTKLIFSKSKIYT